MTQRALLHNYTCVNNGEAIGIDQVTSHVHVRDMGEHIFHLFYCQAAVASPKRLSAVSGTASWQRAGTAGIHDTHSYPKALYSAADQSSV